MEKGESIYQSERPHPSFLCGVVSLLLGVSLASGVFLFIGALCLAWWLPNHHKPNLLGRHRMNTRDESIPLGKHTIPLTDCKVGESKYYYFLHGLPQVRQFVTLEDPDTYEQLQFMIITRFDGKTRLHPIIQPRVVTFSELRSLNDD